MARPKKRKFDKVKVVKAISRERVGRVKATKVQSGRRPNIKEEGEEQW